MKLSSLLLGLAVACALGMVLVLLAFALFQDRLLYFPAPASVGELAQGKFAAWPSAQDFRGLVAEPVGTVRGTAIVFHGNAGHAGHRTALAQALNTQGLRVVLAEYPGYGPRHGPRGTLNERSLVGDAEQAIVLAQQRHGAPLLVVGESLGSGVAAAAAARQPDKLAALMLITPWDRLAQVASFHYPWLPARWLLHDRYDSAAHLASFDRPVMVVVAELDDIVPTRFGLALHAALPGRKRLEEIRSAGHNDWMGHVDEAWWRKALSFLLDGAAPP